MGIVLQSMKAETLLLIQLTSTCCVAWQCDSCCQLQTKQWQMLTLSSCKGQSRHLTSALYALCKMNQGKQSCKKEKGHTVWRRTGYTYSSQMCRTETEHC